MLGIPVEGTVPSVCQLGDVTVFDSKFVVVLYIEGVRGSPGTKLLTQTNPVDAVKIGAQQLQATFRSLRSLPDIG